MKKLFTLTILFWVICILSTQLYAEEGGVIDPIFEISGSARILGMGNAFVGLADEPGALKFNPAGLTQLKMRGFVFENQNFNDNEIDYFSLGYVNPVGKKGMFELGLYSLTVNGIEHRDENNNFIENFSYQKSMTVVGFGWNIRDELSIGNNFIALNEQMLGKEASGFGVNLSAFYRPYNEFTEQIKDSIKEADSLLNSITSDLYNDLLENIEKEEYEQVLSLLPGALSIDPLNPRAMQVANKLSRKTSISLEDPRLEPILQFKQDLIDSDKIIEAYYTYLLIHIILRKEDRPKLQPEIKKLEGSVERIAKERERKIKELINLMDWDTAFIEIQKGEEIVGFRHRFIKLKLDLKKKVKEEKDKHYLKKIGYEIYNQGIQDLNKNKVKNALRKFKAALFLFDNIIDNRLTAGLMVENAVAPKLRLDRDFDQKPVSVKLGFAYRFTENLITSFQAEKTERLPVQVLAGIEYSLFRDRLFLRAGFNKDRVTGGLGVNIKNTSVDYAITETGLGINHKFSVTFKFGKEYARNPVDLFNQGEVYYRDKQYQDALDSWEEALKLDPNYNRARERLVEVNKLIDEKANELLARGEQNFARNEFAKAKENFNEVLVYRPNNFKANEYLIKIEAASKNYIKQLEKDAEQNINNKNYAEAILKYNEILVLDPNRSGIEDKLNSLKDQRTREIKKGLNRVDALLKNHQASMALEEMEELIKLDPENKSLNKQYSKIKDDIIRKEETRNSLNTIDNLVSNGEYDRALAELDNLILQSGKIEQLEKKRVEIIEAREANIKSLLVKANLLINNENYSGAISIYRDVLAVDPDNFEAENAIAELENRTRFSKTMTSYLSRAEKYYSEEKFSKALDSINRALKIDPNNLQAKTLRAKINSATGSLFNQYSNAGNEYYSTGDNDNAVREWAKALKVKYDPDLKNKLVQTAINLGIEYYRKEELKNALEIWEIALEVDPDNKELKTNVERVELEIEKLENLE